MSRTNKDKPHRIRFPDQHKYWFNDEERTKKSRNVDTDWHWLQTTPSWWTNLFMNRPLRHIANLWEKEVVKVQDLDELEDVDKPNVSKKPHKYYW